MEKLTPMMAQYKKIKAENEDCILMFRLGDFYEMFFEDAEEASKILQITLTARNKGGSNKAPMCGIPFHAAEQYIWKLTKAGKKVAICDQMTQPDGKGIVEREVVRIVTPGTTFNENLLEGKSNNYSSAVMRSKRGYGFAYADITTGDFFASEFGSVKELEAEVARIRPSEIVMIEDLKELAEDGYVFRKMEQPFFLHEKKGDMVGRMKEHFEVRDLAVFGLEEGAAAAGAAAALLDYLSSTQKCEIQHLKKPAYYSVGDFMILDQACIRNLELLFTNRDGQKEGSLLSVLDNTVTSAGGRLLRQVMLSPLIDKDKIENRLKKVDALVANSQLIRQLRETLSQIHDLERLLSKLSIGSGNARDLISLKHSLSIIPELKNLIAGTAELTDLSNEMFELQDLVEHLENAIADEPPVSVRDSGMIRDGYNQELDELRAISKTGKTFIKDLQERENKRTGINSLKVKFNNVFGYYIEISKSNLDAVPEDYIRKQTLVNAERFITPELKEYEEKVLTAEDRIKEIEYDLFYKVTLEVLKEIVQIQKTSRAVAFLDLYSNFAFNAEKYRYCRPTVHDGLEMKIKNGRHPVIERLLPQGEFVQNDCQMGGDNASFMLITGPNMGGKSTFLRQIAVITLMAQIGSFVPAESAELGVVDRIFTRVGASDNLVRGESTFMVEMQETAHILNQATEKSLIILDEVGRGTSTYDGVSIAWAITEFIHDEIGAKTLFATHYHELIELAEKLPNAANFSVYVRENDEEGVVFLYKIVQGGVDKSYGIEVAKIAGLPTTVISRSRGVLTELEQKHIGKHKISKDQMDLFAGPQKAPSADERKYAGLSKELSEMDINSMTPLQALEKLNEIKNKC